MADIELVIKIPEGAYNLLKTSSVDWLGAEHILNAVANGTPLPKHGRLIDEKEINTVVNGVFNDFDKYSPETFLNVIHDQCVETIGADMEGKE